MYAAFILRRHRFGRSLNVMSFHTSKGTKNEFKEVLKQAKNIVFLTGAGTSAESGIPTFRCAGGLWRQYQATDLATPGAFKADPSLVWEFYSYRREVVLSKQPNKAHFAMAAYEKQSSVKGKHVTVITQNIDGLHQAAGSKNVLELHGSLFKTRCLTCGHIEENRTSPIVPALAGKGEPDVSATDARIPVNLLPRCSQKGCGSLLRPHVVWFGENLEQEVLEKVQKYLAVCDACFLVNYPSRNNASFGTHVATPPNM